VSRRENPLVVLAQSLWLPSLLLTLWEISSSSKWINPFFFPAPSKILATAAAMLVHGEVVRVLAATLSRWAGGALIGALLGIACGVVMGLSVTGRRTLLPFVSGLYATPKLTIFPLLLLLMGLGNAPKITLVALVSFIFLASQTHDAIRSVKPGYVEMARNYGAGRRALLRRVYLPAALPQIFTGLRLASARSLVVAISLELVSGTDGLGALIWLAWQTLATERLYVGILLAASLGIFMHRGLAALETKLVPWRA